MQPEARRGALRKEGDEERRRDAPDLGRRATDELPRRREFR
jgi:hypothetical protein